MAKKYDYSLFINFFFYSLKNRIIHYFLGPHYSLFIYFGSLFTIHYKKGPLFTNHYTPSRPSYMFDISSNTSTYPVLAKFVQYFINFLDNSNSFSEMVTPYIEYKNRYTAGNPSTNGTSSACEAPSSRSSDNTPL